ncbi:MAG TPA: hypothetical protein VFX45_10290 [Solirubrobacterales bacterium]|nr:hypothetical protein [Solirubrobacterales bacterium]
MHARALTTGPDGNLWFAASQFGSSSDSVGRITPAGDVAEFALPTRTNSAELGVGGVASGPGGLYVTETGVGKIAKVTPAGAITEFALPNPGSRPGAIVLGSDGALWFTEEAASALGRITDGGTVGELPLPPGAGPAGIVAGPDGALWVAASTGNSILRVTTRGDVASFPLPNPGSAPSSIAVGPDGNLWFGEAAAPRIGRITTAGAIEEFPVPGTAGTYGLSAGPAGDIWYLQDGRIGSISPSGAATESVCVSSATAPYTPFCNLPAAALAAGPDGQLWYSTDLIRCQACGGGGTALLHLNTPGAVERFSPPALKIRIDPRVSRVRGRIVKVGVTCGGGVGGQSCNGRALLRARLPRARGGLKRVGIAQRRYTLPTAASTSLSLRLSRNAMAALRKRGKVVARLTVVAEGGEPTVQKLVLRAAGRRGR